MKKIELSLDADPDLSDYTQTIPLSVVIPTDPTHAIFIGYWTPPSPTAHYLHLHAPLKTAQIQLLRDHASYGIWNLPCLASDISSFIHRQITNLNTSSADPDLLAKLSAHIATAQPSQPQINSPASTSAHIFTITALHPTPASASDTFLAPNTRLVWKWAKPASAYRTSGFWETSLDRALVDGEWNAGKGLVLLVRSVSKERFEEIAGERVK